MYKYILSFFIGFAFIKSAASQELNATVIVNGSAVQNTTDPKIFKALQTSLTDFLNKRKWTIDEYSQVEKIDCQFNLTVTRKSTDVADAYEAKLSIQSNRPVFQSDYSSPIMNYVDKDIVFKYVQFQPLDFNENRISGTDVLTANLSAIFAYYSYLIIGLDADSYKLKGGQDFYTKALNIISNAPEGDGIIGWKREGTKNRYWLIDNIMNSRFSDFRQVMYTYHRDGLDQMTKDANASSEIVLNTIPTMYQLNAENPGSAIVSLFFSTKNTEYYNLMTKATTENLSTLVPKISMLDVANAQKYGALLGR